MSNHPPKTGTASPEDTDLFWVFPCKTASGRVGNDRLLVDKISYGRGFVGIKTIVNIPSASVVLGRDQVNTLVLCLLRKSHGAGSQLVTQITLLINNTGA